MNFYRIEFEPGDMSPKYHATLGEVMTSCRAVAKDARDDVRVSLVDVPIPLNDQQEKTK